MKSLLGKIHNVARLRWALLGFVLALGAPAMALVYYSLSELKWETFYQQRNLAIELTERINFKIYHWVELEEQRAYSDYQFNGGSDYQFNGGGPASYFQPSPLSSLDVSGTMPGVIGYFQVGASGEFSSPVLPGNYVDAARYVTPREFKQREALRERILQILLDNQLLVTQQPPSTSPARPLAPNSGLSNRAEETSATSPAYANSVPDSVQEDTLTTASRATAVPSRAVVSALPPSNQPTQQFDQRVEQLKAEPQRLASVEQANTVFDKLKQSQNPEESAQRERALLRELEIDSKLQESVSKRRDQVSASAPPNEANRAARKEQSLVLELDQSVPRNDSNATADAALSDAAATPRVTMFESEIYPFEFSPLNSGHLVFYRKVWREGALIIQGLVLDRDQFFQGVIGDEFQNTVLSSTTDITIAYRGTVMAGYRDDGSLLTRAVNVGGELLHQSRLGTPFNDLELLFSINRLPVGPGALVVRWSAVVMTLVLALGTWLLYRLGLRQMRLAQQQQDFVSAVSHELKTPLTSIRMYGEMLRQGWADEAKKRQYYDYIYDESERLSRLIANVLQLARMNRNELQLNVKAHSLHAMVDNLRSKLHSQIERSGFEFEVDVDSTLQGCNVLVDTDSFLQVFINLVDNALKFSAKSDTKKIQLTVSPFGQHQVLFTLRDFGPGIDKKHMNKIFNLFYRAENELTRETVGTGIGLALVSQLVQSMEGQVDARNSEPGAEFRVYFQLAQ